MVQRRIEIDYAKAIGIFLVILGHVISLQDESTYTGKMIVRYIYAFHMPLFFILSGINISLKVKIDGVVKISRLAKNLIYPYLGWSAVYIILQIIRNIKDVLNIKMWSNIFLGRIWATVTGRGMAPLWFLIALFFAESILLFLIKFKKKCSFYETKNVCIISLLVCASLSMLLFNIWEYIYMLNKIIVYPILAMFRIAPSLFFVLSGYCIGKILYLIEKYRYEIMMISGGVFFILQTITKNRVNMHTFEFDSIFVFLVTGILGSLFIIAFCFILPKEMYFCLM